MKNSVQRASLVWLIGHAELNNKPNPSISLEQLTKYESCPHPDVVNHIRDDIIHGFLVFRSFYLLINAIFFNPAYKSDS